MNLKIIVAGSIATIALLTPPLHAQTLDIPQGTVHSRLNRAMEALRLAIESETKPVSPSPARQEVSR